MNVAKHKLIYVLLFLFLLAKFLAISNYKTVWWDSAVYIGMGRHIYSIGNSGLWEDSRPLIWPLMLGFIWKIGLDVVLSGRILEIIFGGLCVYLAYLIGKEIFNEKAALLASLFLSMSPTFFFFNGIMLTEIVSTSFSLLGIYYFVKEKHFASGAFLGIAFMTRFLQLFVFVGLLFVLFYFDRKNLKKIIIGFLITILPFLILNQILYNNPLFPFMQQINLSKNSGWLNYQTLNHYFVELFKENFLYLLFIPGTFLALKNKKVYSKFIVVIFLFFFIFFNLIKQKEMRFLIVLMPYMYLLVSYSIIYFLGRIKNNTINYLTITVVVFSLIYSAHTTSIFYNNESIKTNPYIEVQNRLDNTQGRIWVTNPIVAVFSDKKIDKLMYYPYFDNEKEGELISGISTANFVFFDSCDLACRPNDLKCEQDKTELIQNFKQKLKTTYSSKHNQCRQFIFEK
ncbi:glycosyltransferase family 39 protein [Candidatus Woesearchaeota archaeon]|nr:glycosyltransferase family 39 protein [Candidatus Woesearchaeota archaeon]